MGAGGATQKKKKRKTNTRESLKAMADAYSYP
jgi:hypothetical protein